MNSITKLHLVGISTEYTLVVLLVCREVQSCRHTSDGNAPCHCIPYDRVTAGHFSNSICSEDVGGTFCWSVCKFLLEHVVWCPSGWTGLLMKSDVTLWCAVGVCWHCDGSCWLNMKGPESWPWRWRHHSFSKSQELFTRWHSITCRKTWILTLSHLWRLEISQMLTHFTSQGKYDSPYVYIYIYDWPYIYIYIFLYKCHCTCTSLCNWSAPICQQDIAHGFPCYVKTLRTGSFKLFKRPLPGFLTILTL